MSQPTKILPYTSVFIKLLKGPVEYLERAAWEKLLLYKKELILFLQQLGLQLIIDEEDGYAYLRHIVDEEDEAGVTWMQRRAFSYDESVLLILLREMMAEFEIGEVTSRELVKKRREIREYAELFFKENMSRVKFMKELDRLIDKAEENGFLDKIEDHEMMDEQKYRIKKLIKAKIDSEVLEQFKDKLTEHAAQRI
ncbi:DUF4194 domain-containing protein [Taibaiella soli]|uniref:DUF4194 domain-containing protein n=1 Tax=Taibaiella soli TaxID=1649169 RepID=A0A2W2AEX4_9BACT|nr:DUF4194 domain-containing protein [Taibaiella soli]PZF72112.1 DUF4194 domain-containing protein [Taibaiella soli]